MADDSVRARVAALLSDLSGAPVASLTAQSTAQNTAGWDSVANLSLMAAIEDEFGVVITTHDAMRMKSLGDIAAYLETRAKS